MPLIKSFADLIRDWQRLLQAFLDNSTALTAAEPQRVLLEQTLSRALDLKARQDSHTAIRQQVTQELDVVLEDGREQARQLRGMAKAILGTRNERLVQFSVAPLRRRSRRGKSPEVIVPKEATAATDEQ